MRQALAIVLLAAILIGGYLCVLHLRAQAQVKAKMVLVVSKLGGIRNELAIHVDTAGDLPSTLTELSLDKNDLHDDANGEPFLYHPLQKPQQEPLKVLVEQSNPVRVSFLPWGKRRRWALLSNLEIRDVENEPVE